MPSRGLTRRDRTVYNIACSWAHCMFTSRPEGQKSTTSEKGVGQHVSVSTRMYRRQPLPSAIRVWSRTRPPRSQTCFTRNFNFFTRRLLSRSPRENYRHHLSLQFPLPLTVIGIICREMARRSLRADFSSNDRSQDFDVYGCDSTFD